jgi:hypothetical protein
MAAYLAALVEERRGQPRNDLISALPASGMLARFV